MAGKNNKQCPPKMNVGSYPHSTTESVRMSGPIQGKSDRTGPPGKSFNRGNGNGK